jgi:hypothetical protein
VTFHGGQARASGVEFPPVTEYQPDDRDRDAGSNRREH